MKQKVFIPILLLFLFSSSYAQNKFDVTHIANSGFLIESGHKKILIDALFKQGWDNYLVPSDSIVSDIINQRDIFNKSNLMLITHNHGDHFDASMVVAYLLNNSKNILIAPPLVTHVISKHPNYKKFENQIVKLDKINQDKNDTTIQGIRVRSFFIQHDSRPQIENVGYLIEIDKLKVFHAGDYNGSEIVEFEKLQLQNENIDVAFLNFYGFWNTAEEQKFTEKYIKPKEIVLMHIPPAEIKTVKDSVNLINDFIDITVFERSMKRKSFVFSGNYSQEFIPNYTGDYLGQTPPKDSAIIFAPGIISVTNRGEYAFSISPNHDEYFYNAEELEDTTQPYGLLHIKRVGDKWFKPQKANLNQEGFWEQEAFFSPNGNDIYYAVSYADSVTRYTKIWLSHKTKNGWSKGELLNSPINASAKRVFYATFSKNGNLYYTNVDKVKIHMSENNNGKYDNIHEIELPRAGHAYISPDEDFIIFDSQQADSYGKTDIYIAFKTNKGNWGEPINLGQQVNTEYLETCPSLSPDGKYIFFGRYNGENEISNIYWISSDIIDTIRGNENIK